MLRPTLVQITNTGKFEYDVDNFSRIEDKNVGKKTMKGV